MFLLRRGEPAGRSCLLAARQYRTAEHRMVHRDSGCLEGRRTRQSRGGTGDGEPEHVRAAGHRGPTGQGRVRRAGPAVRGRAPVPTPVQVLDTELLLEFIGAADGTAAPLPTETRPGGRRVGRAVGPAGAGTRRPGREGFAHGDPARVQPASARRPACDNRLPAGGRCDREPPRRVTGVSSSSLLSRCAAAPPQSLQARNFSIIHPASPAGESVSPWVRVCRRVDCRATLSGPAVRRSRRSVNARSWASRGAPHRGAPDAGPVRGGDGVRDYRARPVLAAAPGLVADLP